MGGGQRRKMNSYQLLPRHHLSVLNPDESKLTLNKHRRLFVSLIKKRVFKKMFSVVLIKTKDQLLLYEVSPLSKALKALSYWIHSLLIYGASMVWTIMACVRWMKPRVFDM